MSKVRVPLHGKPQGYATIDTEATRGATVGTDLFWPDGSAVSAQALAAAMQAGASPPGDGAGGGAVYWRTIMEIPLNVLAAAGLSTAGFVRRASDGAWTAGPIVNDDLGDASTDGLAEGGSNLYFTAQRARDAVGEVSGGGILPMVNGETPPVLMYGGNQLIYARVE